MVPTLAEKWTRTVVARNAHAQNPHRVEVRVFIYTCYVKMVARVNKQKWKK